MKPEQSKISHCEACLDFCFQKRWSLGGLLLLFCVLLELHGSSIGIYAEFLGHPELNDVLIGKNRLIRSDEWNVFTPFAFSQYYNHFSLISNIVRGTATNMFITYGQAVWDIAMIYRPSQWGYLFLSPGAGLSFYWMGRWILLFLVSFEFAWRVLVQKDKALSFCYAAMMAFSPMVQWWFSVNSIAELLISGQGMIILWKLYLSEGTHRKCRFFYMLGMLWSVGIYILSLYPAWQIPFGYAFLLIMLWVTWQERMHFYLLRKDSLFWLLSFIVMIAPLAHIIYESWDMIQITRATEYPGTRFELGGDWKTLLPTLSWFFLYDASLFLPFKDIPIYDYNNSGVANFFSLFPLGMIVFCYLLFKGKKDILLLSCMIFSFILDLWGFLGFPAWLAKISLFSQIPVNRAKDACDFLNMLMLCRGAYLMKVNRLFPTLSVRLFASLLTAGLAAFCVWQIVPNWMGLKGVVISIIVITVSGLIFLSPMRKIGTAFIFLLMFAIGGTVNPLAKGTACVYEQPIGKKIATITTEDNALWMADCDVRNYPIMLGAPTINSVNVYPALSRWKELDSGENLHVYNRYAHIIMQLKDQKSSLSFELKRPDTFQIQVRPSDLKILGIKYIFSDKPLEQFSTKSVNISKLYEDQGFRIYKVDF